MRSCPHCALGVHAGHTVYTLGADGLIVRQDQTWSISALRALQQTFTPASGPRVVPF